MSVVGSYRFHTGVSAFFDMATADAREMLPDHLEPIEVTHQRSILSVTAFLFDDSVVGPYTDAALHGLSSGVYDVAITHPTGYTRYNAQRTQPRSGPIVPGGARAVQSLPNKGLPVTTDADQNAAQ